jgi:hypothetical protein
MTSRYFATKAPRTILEVELKGFIYHVEYHAGKIVRTKSSIKFQECIDRCNSDHGWREITKDEVDSVIRPDQPAVSSVDVW